MKSTLTTPPEEYERAFETLLTDSIVLAQFASDLNYGFDFRNAFARHSIIASLLLIETVANTCLESLDIETSILDEIDKLPVISKFDLFLRIRFRNRKVNRGLQVVAALRDLKLLRDSLAHPKRRRVIWESWSEDEAVSVAEKTSILGLSKYPEYWSPDDAIIVMKSVHDFMKYYFKVLCRFRPSQTSALLFSADRQPNLRDSRIPYWDRSLREALDYWHVDLSYIKLGWMNYGV